MVAAASSFNSLSSRITVFRSLKAFWTAISSSGFKSAQFGSEGGYALAADAAWHPGTPYSPPGCH
jgi:hypothetical protein